MCWLSIGARQVCVVTGVQYTCFEWSKAPGFFGRPDLFHIDNQIAKLVLFWCGCNVNSTPALQHHDPCPSLYLYNPSHSKLAYARAGTRQVTTCTCVFRETCKTLAAVAISWGFTLSASSGLGNKSTCLLVLLSCTGTAATRTCSPC